MKKLLLISVLALVALLYLKSGKHAPAPSIETSPAEDSSPGPRALGAHSTAPAPGAQTVAKTRTTSAPVDREGFAIWLANESARMNRLDSDPRATEDRLQEIARHLTPEQTHELVRRALQGTSENERILSVHLLGLSPETPTAAFTKVASVRDPVFAQGHQAHSPGEQRSRFLTAISLMALNHLQTRALERPADADELLRVAKTTNNPLIARLATQSHASVLRGAALPLEVQ